VKLSSGASSKFFSSRVLLVPPRFTPFTEPPLNSQSLDQSPVFFPPLEDKFFCEDGPFTPCIFSIMTEPPTYSQQTPPSVPALSCLRQRSRHCTFVPTIRRDLCPLRIAPTPSLLQDVSFLFEFLGKILAIYGLRIFPRVSFSKPVRILFFNSLLRRFFRSIDPPNHSAAFFELLPPLFQTPFSNKVPCLVHARPPLESRSSFPDELFHLYGAFPCRNPM